MGRNRKRESVGSSSVGRASFAVGDEVEVRSNDDGFKGAWFEATVIGALSKHRRYTVAYSSLLSDEMPSSALKEVVHASYVRLRPPRPEACAVFGLHQLVDAYHNDGWWAGVVSKLPRVGIDRYSVCFPNTREEFKFKPSELRPQVQWVKGNWVALQDQGGADGMFGVGTRVEVSRDRENFGAAWFVGAVLKVIGKCNFLVEYENLRVDGDDGSGMFLKEIVDLQYIRPSPPVSESKNFDILDEVEAFHGDGWLAGVVVEILPGLRYIVKSKHQEEMELDYTSLRPCRDWIDGHWVLISRDKPSTLRGTKSAGHRRKSSAGKNSKVPTPGGTKSAGFRRKSNAGRRSGLPISVSASSNEDEVADEPDIVILKRKAEGPSHGVQIESSQARKKSKKGKSLEEHLQLVYDMLMECGSKTSTMVEKNSCAIIPMLEESPALMDGHHHSKSPSHERIAASVNVGKKLPSNPTLRELGHGEGISQGNGTAESLISEEESSNCKGEGSEHQSKATYFSHSPVRHEACDYLPIANWGNCEGASGSKEKTKLRRKKLVIRAPHRQRKAPDVIDVKQHAQEETDKRKRGRPPKKKIIHMHDSVDGMELKQLEERTELVAGQEDRRDEVELCIRALSSDVSPTMLLPWHHDEVMENINSQSIVNIEGNMPAWANKQADILEDGYLTPQIESSTQLTKSLYSTAQQLPNVISSSFNNRVEEIPSCVDELDEAGAEAENQAFPSPFKEDIARGHNEPGPSGLPSERVIVMEDERALIDHSPSGSSSENILLPFSKKSSLWEPVGSEEVFRMIPQHPHFRPLEQYSVEFREGIAMGLMVTFANLVADISKLRITDSQQNFEDKLKALDPLESNGFNVQCVRARLKRLLEIQSNLSQSEGEKVALEAKILEREDERVRINVQLSGLDKVILELEKNLTCFREKRAAKILELRNNESEIVNLEMGVKSAEEAFLSAEQQFNTALAAPW